jgi:histidyl-tRNA synthetase
MLCGEGVKPASLDVAVVVEDDRVIAVAQAVLMTLRTSGISADIVATGSPKKRFDKAAKSGAVSILSIIYRDDEKRPGRGLRGPKDMVERIDQLILTRHPELVSGSMA